MKSSLVSFAKDWAPYITVALSALVTWFVVGRAAKKLAAMQYTRSVFDAWLSIDTNLLGKRDLLARYHEIAGHEAGDDPEKITVAFMILNPLRSIHMGIEKGYLRKKDYPNLKDNLRRVLKDPVVFNLSQSELLEESFRRLCLKLAMSPDGNKTLETLAMNARKRIVNLFRISKLKIFRRAALRRHLPRDVNRLR